MALSHPEDRGTPAPPRTPAGATLRVLLIGTGSSESRRLLRWLQMPHIQARAAETDGAIGAAVDLFPSVLVVEAGIERATGITGRVLTECGAPDMGVVLVLDPHAAPPPVRMHPVHLRRPFGRAQFLAAIEQAAAPWRAPAAAAWHERQQREETETLLDLALEMTSRLELQELLQRFTDAARHLTGAAYAAFFHHGGGQGRAFGLGALSGAPREAFEGFGMPRETSLLAPTFAGERLVRCDDIHLDPHYGRHGPHHGLPRGHLPVRSYLGAPVVSREGLLLGALLLGHGEPRVFTRRSERLAAALAAQLAAAIDHHRLLDLSVHVAAPQPAAEAAALARAQLPVAAYACDLHGRIVYYSDLAIGLWGRTPMSDDLWCGARRLYDPVGQIIPLDQSPMARTLRTGADQVATVLVERPDGSRCRCHLEARLLRDSEGRPAGAVEVAIQAGEERPAQTWADALRDAGSDLPPDLVRYGLDYPARAPERGDAPPTPRAPHPRTDYPARPSAR